MLKFRRALDDFAPAEKLATEITIYAAGRKLSMQGPLPLALQAFANWNADDGLIYKLAKDLPAGATFMDIGANVGMVSCSLAVQRPDLKIVAIEPVPQNVDCLKRNVSVNKLINIEVVHAAASDTCGTVHVNVAGPWSTVLPLGQGGEVEVPAVTIDSFADCRPAFVKIDVEGWEPYVLAGARATMASARPRVLMEWNTWSLLVARHDPLAFARAVWESFDMLGQFRLERPVQIPAGDCEIVHDSIVLYGAVTDLLMRPKVDATLPPLEDMIYQQR